jgi:hypothetical protein
MEQDGIDRHCAYLALRIDRVHEQVPESNCLKLPEFEWSGPEIESNVMQPQTSLIDFRVGTHSEDSSVEILIDGKDIAEILLPQRPDSGIPLSLFVRADLPTVFEDGSYPDPDCGDRIVAVCSCGISSCGCSTAQFVREGDHVRIAIKSVRSLSGNPYPYEMSDVQVTDLTFWVTPENYDAFLMRLWSHVEAQRLSTSDRARE